MSGHVRVLAWLNIAMGGFGLLLALLVYLVAGGIHGVLAWAGAASVLPEFIIEIIATVAIGVLLILSLPLMIGGWGLLNFRPWARIVMLIISVLNLLNAPFGLVVGIYGLWVLLKPETEGLFREQAQAA